MLRTEPGGGALLGSRSETLFFGDPYGFGYLIGRGDMEWIHQGFSPGGVLFRRLDGSTPFRRPGLERAARGRSWALHDGILGEPWKCPRMYKPVGEHLQIATFSSFVY